MYFVFHSCMYMYDEEERFIVISGKAKNKDELLCQNLIFLSENALSQGELTQFICSCALT